MMYLKEELFTKNIKKRKIREPISPDPKELSNAEYRKSKKKQKHKVDRHDDELEESIYSTDVVEAEIEKSHKKRSKGRKSIHKEVLEEDNDIYENISIRAEEIGETRKRKKLKTSANFMIQEECTLEDFEEIQNEDLSAVFQTPQKKNKKEAQVLNEDEHLLRAALQQVKPSTKGYISELTHLNYKAIGTALNKSSKEVKLKLKKLVQQTLASKCLHEILSETFDHLSELRMIELKSPGFDLFLVKNKEKIAEVFVNQGVADKMVVASQLWENLLESEREKYNSQPHMKKKSTNGKTPFMVFCDKQKKKNPSLQIKEARTKWNTIKTTKKIRCITKSIEIMMALDSEPEEKSIEEEPDGLSRLKKLKVHGPTKEDIMLLFQHLRIPDMPPKLPAFLYYNETQKNSNPEEKGAYLFKSLKAFKDLTFQEQQSWNQKHKQMWKDHEEQLEAWKEEQDITTLFIYEKTCQKSAVKVKNEKKYKTPDTIAGLQKIEMPLGNIKFPTEPVAPPLIPSRIFAQEIEKTKKEKVSPGMAKQMFFSLDRTSRKRYETKTLAIREAFVGQLRDYVAGMAEEQRKLFLGLKRVRYVRLLKKDIFEDYPSSKYPIYIRPNKKPSATVHEEKKEITEEPVEDEEEELKSEKITQQIPKQKDGQKRAGPRDAKVSPPKTTKKHYSYSFEKESSSDSEKKFLMKNPVVTCKEQVRMDSDSELSSNDVNNLETWITSTFKSKSNTRKEDEEEEKEESSSSLNM